MTDRKFIPREWCRRELEALERVENPTQEQIYDKELYGRIIALIDLYAINKQSVRTQDNFTTS